MVTPRCCARTAPSIHSHPLDAGRGVLVRQVRVEGGGEELVRRRGAHLVGNVALGLLDAGADLGHLGCLLVQDAVDVGRRDGVALGRLLLVVHPRPQTQARDLTRGSILHHVGHGHTAETVEPVGAVHEQRRHVGTHTRLSDLTGHVGVEQVERRNLDLLAAHVVLVGAEHVLVKDLERDLDQSRVRNPGAVVAGLHLAQLVGAHLLHGGVVGLRVVLDGDLRSHTTDGSDTTLVARLDEQVDVGLHEGHRHRHGRTVGEDGTGIVALALDEREDVIPSTTVETRRVLAQLVEDLVHLKGGSDGLDEDGAADGATGHLDVVLREVEDVVPQTRLEVALHLGQVEVRAVAGSDELVGVVEEVETKVDERAGHGLAVDDNVLLVEVPSTRAHEQHGGLALGLELVLLVVHLEVDAAVDGGAHVDLAVHQVGPGGRGRVLKVGHVGVGTRVERVDHHLAVDGTGDLHTSVTQTGCGGSALPGRVVSDVSGFGEKVGQRAAVESGLSKLTGLKQRLTGAVKGAVENSEEPESLGGEDGCLVTLDLACWSKQNGRGTAARRWSVLCERTQSRAD
ncbi:hypothetical protein L1887_51469 [Cichorium endivia]|nr:hypothetical protein L1887_51469 [Cichorium endivia]